MQQHSVLLERLLLLGLLGGLIALSFEILKYFIIPIVWAAIIAYTTWGMYQFIYRYCRGRRTVSASLMTLLVLLVVGIPVTVGVFMLQREGQQLFIQIQHQLMTGALHVPPTVERLPVIGKEITRILNDLNHDPRAAINTLRDWFQAHIGYGRYVLTGIAQNLAKFGLTIMTLFFFYRHGEELVRQLSHAIERVIGARVHDYFATISATTRAVVYGIGLTALAQSLLAGLSYVVAGVSNPVLLTLITFIMALVPFGPPIAYGSVALWLFSQGQVSAAIGVLAWGLLIVSSADNVIRPLVISGATQIPFLLIMFGVLGGIASFGLVGLFIGPVILAVLLACWNEWQQQITLDRSTDSAS